MGDDIRAIDGQLVHRSRAFLIRDNDADLVVSCRNHPPAKLDPEGLGRDIPLDRRIETELDAVGWLSGGLGGLRAAELEIAHETSGKGTFGQGM